MTGMGLTAKQASVKRFIAESNKLGRPPTYDAIAAHMGSRHRSKAFAIVRKLSERGHVMRFLTPGEAAAGKPGHIIAIGN